VSTSLIKTTVRAIGKPINLVFIGLDYAGKTAMFIRLRTGKFQSDLKPTISSTMDSITIPDDDGMLEVNIIDLGGQKMLRDQWKLYIEKINSVIFVIDSNDRERFAEAKEEFQQRVKPALKGQPCIIACNKTDLHTKEDRLNIETEIEKLLELGQDNQFLITSTSQKTGYGLPKVTKFLRERLSTKRPI
jgi:ADP-ribosylation factor protein 1/Arf/Sar family protein